MVGVATQSAVQQLPMVGGGSLDATVTALMQGGLSQFPVPEGWETVATGTDAAGRARLAIRPTTAAGASQLEATFRLHQGNLASTPPPSFYLPTGVQALIERAPTGELQYHLTDVSGDPEPSEVIMVRAQMAQLNGGGGMATAGGFDVTPLRQAIESLQTLLARLGS